MVSGLRPGRGVGGLDLEDVAEARHGGQGYPVGGSPHVGTSVQLVDDRNVTTGGGQAHGLEIEFNGGIHALVRIQGDHADDGVGLLFFR